MLVDSGSTRSLIKLSEGPVSNQLLKLEEGGERVWGGDREYVNVRPRDSTCLIVVYINLPPLKMIRANTT